MILAGCALGVIGELGRRSALPRNQVAGLRSAAAMTDDATPLLAEYAPERTIVAGVRVGGDSGTFMALPALPDMAGGGAVFHFRAPELEGTLRELPDTFRRLLPQVRPGR